MADAVVKEWKRLLDSSSVHGISTAADGSIYITGFTEGSLDGQTNSGLSDAFISKYSSDGTKAWTRLLGSSYSEHANGISTAADGSIYITGWTSPRFTSIGSFDGQTYSVEGGDKEAFISKYSSDGTRVWTRLLGSPRETWARGISTAADGSIYITGYVNGSLHGQTNSGYDAFISKYSSDGTRVWTRLLGGSSADGRGISTAADGSIYITGWTHRSLDGQTHSGDYDAFISKYSSDGTKAWTRLLGSSYSEHAFGISTAADGSIYITGLTEASLDGQIHSGRDNEDTFISKYSSDGTKVWTRLINSSFPVATEEGNSISTAADGSIYITGLTYRSFDGQTPIGHSDAFISKYSSDGTRVWTRFLGSSYFEHARGISTAADGSIYIVGRTYESLDGQYSRNRHAFIRKFDAATITPIYSLSTSATSINEGSTLTTTVTTTYLTTGTTLYYTLSGTGITSADFSSGSLTGSGSVGNDGKFSFSHNLANDLTTEGTENLEIKLFSDSAQINQVATATAAIQDTSTTPIPTYRFNTSSSSVREGYSFSTTVSTTNLPAGTPLYYTLSGTGITSADFFSGSLTGSGSIGPHGKFSFSHTLANDLTTEGNENLEIKLFTDPSRSNQVATTTITIQDSSLTPAPPAPPAPPKKPLLTASDVSGDLITLRFDRALSTTRPSSSAFSVTADGRSISVS
ncbi:MAG: hypothetical protein FJ077_14475, partial [Cyanobacteria bacterium K_DeepCast_35m_m2_023]|nr:hypothetical protein [Cyanobacteria bacterium K_DeepCast_35m_m2_023]